MSPSTSLTSRSPAVSGLADPDAAYRLLAETATDVVSLHDMTGTYLWISPSVRAAFGYGPDEVLGRSAFEFTHPDDTERIGGVLSALHHVDFATAEFRIRAADGRYVWIESSIRAVHDEETGEPTAVRVASRDITARKAHQERAERTTAELRRRLAQTSAVARLGELALEQRDPSVVVDAAVGIVRGVLDVEDVAAGEDGVIAACPAPGAPFDEYDRDFLQSVSHVCADAIERRAAEERARHAEMHDPLTGLPNRALLVDRLEHALRRRRAARLGVFLLDLDDFGVVNDSLGHAAGDEVIVAVARRLEGVVGAGDTVARFGADAFAVLSDAVENEGDAQRLAERLTGALLSGPFVLPDGERLHLTASVGVVVPTRRADASELLRDAGAALHRAKKAGRGRYELFDPRMRDRVVQRMRTEAELRRALAEDELRVHFQPFFSLPGRELAGYEALVRWEHPDRGLVPPGEFIPVAEHSGLIVQLGTRVLREACRQIAAFGRDDLRLTVNLSARQVEQPGLVETVSRALTDSGLAPDRLGLEITEGLLMDDSDGIADTLRALKGLGVRLVLDDFGTGYSSLSYLKRFPLDQLKIDRSFVGGICEREEDRAIVRAIVAMAQALGLGVIPEGIETEEQLALLESLGCEYAQGFLLGRPAPLREVR